MGRAGGHRPGPHAGRRADSPVVLQGGPGHRPQGGCVPDGKKKPVNPVWKALYPLADLLVLRHIRDNLGLAKCYYAFSGGAAMAPDGFRFFHAIGVDLRNGYGATEIGLLTVHMGKPVQPRDPGQMVHLASRISGTRSSSRSAKRAN